MRLHSKGTLLLLLLLLLLLTFLKYQISHDSPNAIKQTLGVKTTAARFSELPNAPLSMSPVFASSLVVAPVGSTKDVGQAIPYLRGSGYLVSDWLYVDL